MRNFLALLVIALLTGCTTQSVAPYPRPAPQYAASALPDGAFADIETRLGVTHGGEYSGFRLLGGNEEALRWRLALIGSAR